MRLLYWSELSPHIDDGLAAVRFATPIRISSIAIFPNGARPFACAPDLIARTEPQSFFLQVFFNVHPSSTAVDAKDKPRAANALVPTLIAYPGGHMNFPVNMGPDFATRLMIVKGKFSVCFLAVYGQAVTDAPPPTTEYEPSLLSSTEPLSLAPTLFPANSHDPTHLARQLLALIPDAPPLALIIRLLFCLKPSLDDWNLPEFPYLHPNLELQIDGESDLESVIQTLSRPVQDEAPDEILSAFATRVAALPKGPDHAYHIANLLSISACQHTGLARALIQQMDLFSIFNAQSLDEGTLLCLLDAATNVDIAKHFDNHDFLDTLDDLQASSKSDKSVQLMAKRLRLRIRHWSFFEDALYNTRGNFNQSMEMLRDVVAEEQAMGIWLESMIAHDDIASKLGDNSVLPTQSLPPLHFYSPTNISSHDDFISIVRAFLGVASLLAVWAWADELGNDACRERALSILHLWQGVDSYREIVNYLLPTRQFTRRLKWIISDSDHPRKSGMLAEKVLANLAKDPHAVLQPEVTDAILSLRLPLTSITEDELRELQKIALVSEDGLPAAVDELLFTSDRPFSHRRLRVLRVALAILLRELDSTDGEWRILQAFKGWEGQSPGVVSSLVDILTGVSDDLNGYFAVSPSLRMNQTLTEQLFRTADDIIRLVSTLVLVFPLYAGTLRQLVIAIADIFASADLADMMFAQTSGACMAAQEIAQACLDTMRVLTGPKVFTEPGKLGADGVFRALLQHAGNSRGRDPAYHLARVFAMVDYILPDQNSMEAGEESNYWVTSILPNTLEEIKAAFRILDPENKIYFLKRLVNLDQGSIEIGEWILLEEVKWFYGIFESLMDSSHTHEYRLILHYEASLLVHFLLHLLSPSWDLSQWCIDAISGTSDLSVVLSACLVATVDGQYTSPRLRQLVSALAQAQKSFDSRLKFSILLASLHASQHEDTRLQLLGHIAEFLEEPSTISVDMEHLLHEIGKTLWVYSRQRLEPETSESILPLLEWLTRQSNETLSATPIMTRGDFSALSASMLAGLADSKHDVFHAICSKLTFGDDDVGENTGPLPETILPESLVLPREALNTLFRRGGSTPSTPRGTKTPDVLGVIISPPTAILRANGSMSTTGLTKTYLNNDFRQLRLVPSARQNTSRLPSMHVDVGINGRLAF